ncbi:MAG: polysaccharide biosynthesis protein [Anaerolineae bacterium]|nr:polysaccharide biosynthesis protein [Phycisphaerae bacterium]
MNLGWLKRSIRKPVRAQISSIDVAQLLGRKPVNLDTPELQRFLAGKRVLVTGAGGSIGSEICRQTMRFCPDRLVLLDRAENALFEIDRELRERWVGAQLIPSVADVCDSKRIGQVFDQHKPQVIFHAAAHKHVPMMEHNPGEAVKNNVFGTKVVADAAAAFNAQAFVLISTDKAVRPTSVMGATKRVAELYVQSMNYRDPIALDVPSIHPAPSHTRFLAVRFGNVLGSSGSVVPIFGKQIDAGGPVTVTHPDMKRYFMTIPEASRLVMQAGAIGKGGEIFVLDMGEPVKILDLALQMIRRSGLKAGRDIEIHYTGVRPGEKLYEELAGDDERTCPTSHRKIRVWQLPVASRGQVKRAMELLRDVVDANSDRVKFALRQCVPEYSGSETSTPTMRLVTDAERIERAA